MKENQEMKEKNGKNRNSREVSAVPGQAGAPGRALVPPQRLPRCPQDAAVRAGCSQGLHTRVAVGFPACCLSWGSLVGPCAQADGEEGAIKAVTHSCLSAALPTFIA